MHVFSSDTFPLGTHPVRRLGYGAMQLAGPGVLGPPRDRQAALSVLREAVAHGVDHLDTSELYGPHVTNALIREALHPYKAGLVIATKVGMVRGPNGSWDPAFSADELERQVHDNLKNLDLEVLDLVYFRASFSATGPAEGSIEAPLTALLELQRRGLVRALGLSNVTATQVEEARRLGPVVAVQNHYNLLHRHDDPLIDRLAADGIAYVPYFPLGGFSPLQSGVLQDIARRLGATPMQVALAWLLQRAPNMLPIPGTSSLAHLRENLASVSLKLEPDDLVALDQLVA
ncbi:MAG TPA: oxidoreductase [Myxococcota bacterium]|nr:oxidoreductase [Myxococcota bacterium]